MSVYRPKKKDGTPRSAIYLFDFWLTPAGKTEPERFQGSTGQKSEARAKRVEDEKRELAKLGKLSDQTTVAEAAQRYINEVAISGRRQSSWLEMTKASYIADFGSFKTRQLKKRRTGLQTVALTEREREIVEAAIALSPPDCPWVFTARSGRNYDAGKRIPIRDGMLRRAVKSACKKANIHDFKPHDFRHTFASRALRKDGNLKKLQESLDHSNIRSTMRYAHVLQDDVVKYRAKVTVARPGLEAAEKPVPKRRTKVG